MTKPKREWTLQDGYRPLMGEPSDPPNPDPAIFAKLLSGEIPRPLIGLATLSGDSTARKGLPIATGLLDYFGDALVATAEVSRLGNDKHNPGEPLHWARGKGGDNANELFRHFIQRGTWDTDRVLHSARVAWRANAILQLELETLFVMRNLRGT